MVVSLPTRNRNLARLPEIVGHWRGADLWAMLNRAKASPLMHLQRAAQLPLWCGENGARICYRLRI